MNEQFFLHNVFNAKNAVISEGNCCFKFLGISDEVLQTCQNRRMQSQLMLQHKMNFIKKLLLLLQEASQYVKVYGRGYSADCFYGEGKYINDHIKRKNGSYFLDLDTDLWNGKENFWVSNDYHKTVPRLHPNGDFYFFVDPSMFNWESFFESFHSSGSMSFLKSTVQSRTGYSNISDFIHKDSSLIVFEFFSQTIRAKPETLERLIHLFYAFSEVLSWEANFDSKKLLFGSDAEARKALDFNYDYQLKI